MAGATRADLTLQFIGESLIYSVIAMAMGCMLAELLLPRPVDHVLLQADLTAVAPGPLEEALARDLATVARVESRGGATVYRFSPQSLRRALDAGRTPDDVRRRTVGPDNTHRYGVGHT